MTKNNIIDSKENELETALARHDKGAVIMLELPAENYFEANASSVKFLTTNGYEGVYVSFNRPFKNISSLLEWHGIDINRLFIVDGAIAFSGETQEKNPRCINISSKVDIDEMVQVICASLSKLKSEKKFVFVDSLTTMGLYKPLSDMKKFSEFLVRAVKKHKIGNVTFLFNIAEDPSQKRFIKDMDPYTDEFIHFGRCT